jgi:CDP-glucose 4,6-dehydratase
VDDLELSDGFWAGRSVLVTGAAGLLGGWVVRTLSHAGAEVAGLDIEWSHGAILGPDDEFDEVDGDVRDAELVAALLEDRQVETVVHLAAQAIVGDAEDDPVASFEHNVLGTWVVLEACRRSSSVASVVVASSDKAYGDHGGDPYREEMPLLARHPYAASKTCADVIAQTYAESYGLWVAITRCGNLYGGGDTEWSRIVPGTIRSLLAGERPVIRSNGRFVRDYLYVEDAAEGVLSLAGALEERAELRGHAFNFAGGIALTVLELVEQIGALIGSDVEPEVLDEAINEIIEQRVDATKARDVLGWRPAHTLEQGLERTIGWYRSYLGAPA